jgi:hypothetical protein
MTEILAGRLEGAGTTALFVAMVGALVGMLVWLVGARFSRGIITLAMVTVGAWVGLRVPRFMDWPVSNWATCVSGALLLGLTGYCWHRIWVGVGLAVVMTSWAGLFVWIAYGAGQTVAPVRRPMTPMWADYMRYYRDLWAALPGEVKSVGPFLCGIALVSATCIALLWNRLAGWTLYSILGVSLLVGMSLAAMVMGRPAMLGLLPSGLATQLAVLVSMVGVGMIVQWKLAGEAPVVETPRRHAAVASCMLDPSLPDDED